MSERDAVWVRPRDGARAKMHVEPGSPDGDSPSTMTLTPAGRHGWDVDRAEKWVLVGSEPVDA